MPAISAARKTVIPSGTSICFPLIVICTMRSSFLHEFNFRGHFTFPSGTASQKDVCFNFRSKMLQHITDRDRGGLTQTTVGCPFHFLCQADEDIQVFEFALSLRDAFDDLIRALRTDPTRCALSARLKAEELQQHFDQIYNTSILITDQQGAGTE